MSREKAESVPSDSENYRRILIKNGKAGFMIEKHKILW